MAGVIFWYAKSTYYTNASANTTQARSVNRTDERNIDDSDSIGTGIKFTFIDAVTGQRIRNEKVTLESDNGIRCDTFGCDSTDTLRETQTDHNGVTFIDFKQWPKFFFGHVNIDNWSCAGGISTSQSDKYLYLTPDAKQFLVECVSKMNSTESHSRLLKLLVAGTNEELRNTPVRVDIENCGGDSCSDLEDVTLTTNQLGNLFLDDGYASADTYLIIDGYKPASIRNMDTPEKVVYFTQVSTIK